MIWGVGIFLAIIGSVYVLSYIFGVHAPQDLPAGIHYTILCKSGIGANVYLVQYRWRRSFPLHHINVRLQLDDVKGRTLPCTFLVEGDEHSIRWLSN
ncbi:MAG: hypothetical protein A3E36_02525 [Candidatus Andersenbacteria bacterium RIFCSPHIGHO2_12_FULL_45_11b]|uniref:Uncharacterized protein n=1 Tax=Candidatus Andersenbacteria bacterium RIFCSPHIGHO2_12_FULL_45_11b TaxID=1797282 RepID=A0A1G1XD40_9BACT|nr:MAG: hypothetical protein A3E36_02525 [Candidatus Andersenbacteria bacterium RIFCSPHIGHO2_12_FULL_45_11b]